MSALSTLESFDLLRFSETFHSRLVAAQEDLNAKRGFEREKQWLATAVELLSAERRAVPELLERARTLPELADVAFELASSFQETWVDALEKLLAGIMFHAGSRSPVIEAVFPHQKFPALRRANKDAAVQFATEFERRLKSSYVTRMMSGDEFSFAKAVLDQISTAYGKWHACFAPPPMAEEDATRLREELPALAKKLDLAMGQARLLAEAALLPFDGAYDGTGLNAKPRKRSAKQDVAEAVPAAEAAPAEPAKPEAKPEKAAAKSDKAEAKAAAKPEAKPEKAEPEKPVEAAPAAPAAEATAPAAGEPKAEKPPKAKRAKKAAAPAEPAPEPTPNPEGSGS
ncbi:MAG TPA: hypothetical protein VK447_15820 [Myxococcaceae bacterium]|nr:hypothetical protein [Myxococcaceae bacterium]